MSEKISKELYEQLTDAYKDVFDGELTYPEPIDSSLPIKNQASQYNPSSSRSAATEWDQAHLPGTVQSKLESVVKTAWIKEEKSVLFKPQQVRPTWHHTFNYGGTGGLDVHGRPAADFARSLSVNKETLEAELTDSIDPGFGISSNREFEIFCSRALHTISHIEADHTGVDSHYNRLGFE